ncbi:MAG: LON peptidase substrate-binding domain-containing protein, partial [Candidatus Polarisedimenticolia bacterium]
MSEAGESGPVVVDEEAAELGSPDRRPPPIPPTLPILPLRETVVFPHLPVPLAVGRPASLRLVDQAMVGAKMIGLVLQRTGGDEEPGPADLHHVGTAAVIQRLLKFPDGTVRVLVSGIERIRIRRFVSTAPFLTADVEVLPGTSPASVEIEALHKNLQGQIRRLLSLMPIASEELGVALLNVDDPGRLADMTAALLVRDTAIKQTLLETLDVAERLRALTRHLAREIEVMELGSKIQKEVETEMEKGQREFVLRQQLKAIQKELGDGDNAEAEIETLRQAIEQAGMPEAAKEAAGRELNRLRTMSPAS